MIRFLLAIIFILQVGVCLAQDSDKPYVIHGTIRTKYEYEPQIDKGRFEVRNARIGISGNILAAVLYKAEVDLSDEGTIKMLDAYIRFCPKERLKFSFGQMRVPFSIDAHRSPHLRYFANRSFLAKQVGNVRDVGISASYSFGDMYPVAVEGGIFNGSGITHQKDYWTNDYNFSLKAQTMLDKFNIALSLLKASTGEIKTYLYDVGAYFQNSHWHIEAEYLRKYYVHKSFKPVNAVNAFFAYTLPLHKTFSAISFLGRYDYMSDHCKGISDNDGVFEIDDPERHRLTGGITLSLGKDKLQSDLRINYEQYFYNQDVTPLISEQSKIVVELVVHF